MKSATLSQVSRKPHVAWWFVTGVYVSVPDSTSPESAPARCASTVSTQPPTVVMRVPCSVMSIRLPLTPPLNTCVAKIASSHAAHAPCTVPVADAPLCVITIGTPLAVPPSQSMIMQPLRLESLVMLSEYVPAASTGDGDEQPSAKTASASPLPCVMRSTTRTLRERAPRRQDAADPPPAPTRSSLVLGAAHHDLDADAYVAKVAACRVLDTAGAPRRIYDVWRSRPVVHVFLRQFGCLFCHSLVAELLDAAPRIGAAGAHVVMVGCGSAAQALAFADDKRIPREHVSIYTDPTRASFEAASLARSWRATFLDAGARRAYARARRAGHAITGVAGDVAQLGGVMVVRPPAHLAYLHVSRFAGDHAPIGELLGALEAPSAHAEGLGVDRTT